MIRPFAIGLLGLSLVGCEVRMPPPTQQEVRHKDVVGTTWLYRGTAPAINSEITLNADETYTLVCRLPGSVLTNRGWWRLSGSYLDIVPSDPFQPSRQGALERHRLVRWWFTDVSTNQVVLFGGDSLDPHQWAIQMRVGIEPAVASRPFPAAIGPARSAWHVLALTIGFSLIAGLAVCLAVGVVLRFWDVLSKQRSAQSERPSGASVASAVLPQIEHLRGSSLSGAPVRARQTPGHNWLIVTSRRLVARFNYFRRRETPDTVAPDETPHKSV